VRIGGRLLTLAHECSIDDIPHWAMRNENNIIEYESQSKLKYFYDITKTLVFVQVEDAQRNKATRRVPLIADLPEVQRKRYMFRRGLIDEVGRLATSGCTHQIHHYEERKSGKRPVTVLEHICSEVARTIGIRIYEKERSCSVSTYYRWLALYGEGSDPRNLEGDFGKVDKKDYDPAKNAVIGFRHLLWLWHHWLLTIYHPLAPRTGMRMSPNDRWLAGTRIIKPAFLDQSRNLDFLFGIVREGTWTLDHRGVIYEGLYYYSDGLDVLRHLRGATLKVRVKVNPLDLLWIQVWDEKEKLWIPAKARQEAYATGLPLHCHILFRRHSDRLAGRDDLEGWIEAHAHLQYLIRSALPDALSIALQTKMARAMGIGTPYLFRNLHADGRLIAPPGAAIDLPLNPLSTAAGSAADPAQPNGTSPETASAAQKQRPIPQFKSDLTLGQRR
jgi:hypothetical protein